MELAITALIWAALPIGSLIGLQVYLLLDAKTKLAKAQAESEKRLH